MNTLAILSILIGVIYFIYSYSLMKRKKMSIYLIPMEIIEGQEMKFLNLQLLAAWIVSSLFVLVGLFGFYFDLSYIWFIALVIIFQLSHLIVGIISKHKGYIKIKKGS